MPARADPRARPAAQDVLAVARGFALDGDPVEAAPLGSGHIHDTFSVRCEGGGGASYVVQRLNAHVFREPEALVDNALLVTRAVREALARRGETRLARRCLTCVPTRSGDAALPHGGAVWRAFERIEGTRTFDAVASVGQARDAARAFGEFAALLADVDPASLRLTIPGFHDFDARTAAFEAAVRADPSGRGAGAAPEIARMRAAREQLARVLGPETLASLPIRVVHNDCKLNNVLFDAETGEALCVIDLDTVMPGSLLMDFGDLVRTAACREPEDSTAIERVRVEPDLYAALAEGYLEGAAPLVTAAEREHLPLAGPLIALETGMRFLADHLEGDRYFRVAREDHNLHRARNQLRLAEQLLDALADARRIVARIP